MKKMKLNVIGDPINHSMSPVIHGRVLDELGISYEYDRVLVKKGELRSYIESAIDSELSGFNLTMPHKVDIIPFLDEIDDDAKLFGAVNTVKIKNGKLFGYNTDAEGFVLSLRHNNFDVADKDVVFLGGGGVVSTLALKFSVLGAKNITILNRTKSKAKDICERIEDVKQKGLVKTRVTCDSDGAVKSYMRDCDMLINATPLGMTGVRHDYNDLSFFDKLNKDALVSDLIYSPPQTKFLKYADDLGLKTMNGYGMLIGQAILADEIYLDKKIVVGELLTKLMK